MSIPASRPIFRDHPIFVPRFGVLVSPVQHTCGHSAAQPPEERDTKRHFARRQRGIAEMGPDDGLRPVVAHGELDERKSVRIRQLEELVGQPRTLPVDRTGWETSPTDPDEASPMRNHLTILFATLLVVPGFAADWKPAPGPLMTKWGKLVTPENAWKEYPRPQVVRKEWTNLNGLWDYAITNKDAKQPEKWDGQILVPFCIESSLSGVGRRVSDKEALWYRRTFTKSDLRGRHLLLHFGAVDWHCKVTVNGKEVGEHKGGFDPFSFDITEAIRDGEQELVVWVWDPTEKGSQPVGKQLSNPHSIWYTPVTGIWQTVWLEPVPLSPIDKIMPVPDVDNESVTVTVHGHDPKQADRVRAVALLGGKEVGSATGSMGKPFSIKVADPKLWSPDSPVLYDLVVTLLHDDQAVEEVTSYFALRKIAIGKDDKGVRRLLLNNKPLFQLGPLDQGWWPDGLYTAPSDEALAYDLKVLKDLGMNMLRKHIKVEPSLLYYHCDKLGLMVWQDMPSVINRSKKHFVAANAKEDASFTAEETEVFDRELKAMMDHLSFFPCIVAWVPFNEGWGQHDTNEVLQRVIKYDPTRLVDGPSGWADRGVGHMKDMHMY